MRHRDGAVAALPQDEVMCAIDREREIGNARDRRPETWFGNRAYRCGVDTHTELRCTSVHIFTRSRHTACPELCQDTATQLARNMCG